MLKLLLVVALLGFYNDTADNTWDDETGSPASTPYVQGACPGVIPVLPHDVRIQCT